jgi:DNA-directed RNA polymerase specialized sigma24 family protein
MNKHYGVRCRADTRAHNSACAVGAAEKAPQRTKKIMDLQSTRIGAGSALCSGEGVTPMMETARNIGDVGKDAADLYRLAFLLTGRQELSIEVAADTAVSADYATRFFTDWMRGWQRRLVLGRALTAIHDELADSARRTQLAADRNMDPLPRNWSLGRDTKNADVEQALLAIDPFPRAALLLLVFEGIRMADAATLLDAEPTLIRKAQAIGLCQLTANLAGRSITEAPRKNRCWLRAMALCN